MRPRPITGFPSSVPSIASLEHRVGRAGAFDSTYGREPEAESHGEAFLNLFRQRLVPRPLYLLDEPEAALSPQSQLGLLAMGHDAVSEGSQFVVATHSPILMAIPNALIPSFDDPPIRHVSFAELEPADLVRRFLADPEVYLRRIWGEDG